MTRLLKGNKLKMMYITSCFIYQMEHISMNITMFLKLNFDVFPRIFCPGEEFIEVLGDLPHEILLFREFTLFLFGLQGDIDAI